MFSIWYAARILWLMVVERVGNGPSDNCAGFRFRAAKASLQPNLRPVTFRACARPAPGPKFGNR